MNKPIQKRTMATRARLIAASQDIIESDGFGALRVEEVVKKAGVAKGTFFAHFRDKDALMEIITGARINEYLDEIENLHPPQTVDELVGISMPLIHFMTSERYVFDLIIRHSGAAAKEEIGPIAETFIRQVEVYEKWLNGSPFRKDVSAMLLAEGIQAFAVQAMALHFCAIQSEEPLEARLTTYLKAWLEPPSIS